MIRVAVVGHVEWVDFVLAPRLPAPGAIADAERAWEAAAGGGAMAAYALRSLIGDVTFFCAVGGDERGEATVAALLDAGVRVRAARRSEPQRRTLTWLTADHERTITTLGPRMEPSGDDPLGWDELSSFDAVVLFGGDASAARAARRARVLVATARTRAALLDARVEVDALVGSADDATEPLDAALLAAARPRWIVETEGARGGGWRAGREGSTPGEAGRVGEAAAAVPGEAGPLCDADQLRADGGPACGRWLPAPLPGPAVDAFGCGDAFAAAVAAGLGLGWEIERACALGARVGAAVLCERAPAVGELAALVEP